MKRLFGLLLLLSSLTAAQAQSIAGPPFIAVHGKAETAVVPDIFPLKITLQDTSMDAAKTQALIEGYAQQVLALTQSMRMAERDVEVAGLSVLPQYRYDEKDEKQVFLGNTYRREIKLRFHRLADMQKLIESLPQAKQVQLEALPFESSKADELRRELMTAAVADARKTAEVAAQAVGKRLGNVHNLSNQGFNVRYVESFSDSTLDRITVSGSHGVPAPAMALREGTIQLNQNVYVMYLLAD